MTSFKSVSKLERGKMPVKKTSQKNIKTTASKVVSTKASKPLAKTTAVEPTVAKKPMVSKASPSAEIVTPKKIAPKKLIKPLVILLILALLYLLKDEVIVASVNGRPITRWALVRNLEKQGAATTLENMTTQLLIEQELQKAGIVVTDEELDADINTLAEQLSAQGQNLDDLLKAQGYTRNEIKQQLSLSKGMEKLLADKITVSDDEIKAYFENNKEAIGTDVKLEDVSENIKNQLKQEKLNTEEQKWFSEIQKASKINYYKFAPSNNL
jgi:foldase protein PrsA